MRRAAGSKRKADETHGVCALRYAKAAGFGFGFGVAGTADGGQRGALDWLPSRWLVERGTVGDSLGDTTPRESGCIIQYPGNQATADKTWSARVSTPRRHTRHSTRYRVSKKLAVCKLVKKKS